MFTARQDIINIHFNLFKCWTISIINKANLESKKADSKENFKVYQDTEVF